MYLVKIIFTVFILCFFNAMTLAESPKISSISPENFVQVRPKRSLLLKKKILGAGILGLGVGVGVAALKGIKYGYYKRPYSYYPSTFIQSPVYSSKPYNIVGPPHYSYSNYESYY